MAHNMAQKVWSRFVAGGALLVLAVAGIAATGPAPKASALGCHYYWDQTHSVARQSVSSTGGSRVPYSNVSGCKDVNIRSVYVAAGVNNSCGSFRVRFFPSSGGSYTNSWKQVCTSSGPKVLATNVLGGTWYSIETSGTNTEYGFQTFD
jgi:hypothetical protein